MALVTLEECKEYEEYSNIAIKLFNYMNGRVNQMNICLLNINSYDFINDRYGDIQFPNKVCIYIGNIMNTWRDEWKFIIDKRDYICTCIAWAICHELHHADQLISMIQYNSNKEYKNKIECDVERASYEWVRIESINLSRIGEFNCIIEKLESPTMPIKSYYTKATAEQFYLQTMENIVIRDSDMYRELKIFTNPDICDDIVLVFNDIDSIVIKSNKRYLYENIYNFCNLVDYYCSRYTGYRIRIEVVFSNNAVGRCIATVNICVTDSFIQPMQYRI